MQPAPPKTLSRRATYMVALLGLAVVLFYLRDGLSYLLSGKNDYLQLYAGARLVHSSNLYDPRQVKQVQMESAGFFGERLEYNRLPFYAAALWPLSRLPYVPSYVAWQSLSLGALVGFVLMWRIPSREAALMACCWSAPLLLGIAHGQDLTFLLLILAGALRIYPERLFAGGALLSLCAIKFHFFLLLPLVMAGQKQWRMLWGFLAGGALLTVLSFAAAGFDWPYRYVEMLGKSADPEQQMMPNFHGLFLGVPNQHALELLFGLATVGAVWWIARRTDLAYGLAAALVGGLLISYHAYPQDCTLLVPALLVVFSRSSDWRLNYLCIALFTPWPYLVLIQDDPLKVVRLAIAVLLVGMLVQCRRGGPQWAAAA
ncbi:MAG TPA: glycosyltransferase family 87 protein [Terriglobales bacterium]|nr:glycosyltransferase family 87 protein [Terriglobales bacterium]